MIWGRRDPIFPLKAAWPSSTTSSWLEVNGAHILRARRRPCYDTELTYTLYRVLDLFRRKLGEMATRPPELEVQRAWLLAPQSGPRILPLPDVAYNPPPLADVHAGRRRRQLFVFGVGRLRLRSLNNCS
jgi:hypothetical protein